MGMRRLDINWRQHQEHIAGNQMQRTAKLPKMLDTCLILDVVSCYLHIEVNASPVLLEVFSSILLTVQSVRPTQGVLQCSNAIRAYRGCDYYVAQTWHRGHR